MEDWYILSDIPYQKGFPLVIDIDWEPNTYYWNINTNIPYMHEFPNMISINQRPLNPDVWYILSGIPYHQEFPKMIAINNEPGSDSWYILDNIPYMKEYPQIEVIDVRPLNPDIWYIDDSIPYHKEFPSLYIIEPITFVWYILDSIPYMPQFPGIDVIDAKPRNPDIWYIDDSIPYHKEFPSLYIIEPITFVWYILDSIPYLKEFPQIYPLEPIPLPHENRYYVVGKSLTGRWQVRSSSFSHPDGWTLLEDLGPSSAVMAAYIEADGDFDYKAGRESMTLTTQGEPWLAVITTTKKLYVKQVRADISTAQLIDTDVEEAALCRGWKSARYNVDAGLILVYRKFQGVFIRRYREVNGEMIWEAEEPLLEYDYCTHIEVKRLNDFRIAVFVNNPNRVLITDRYYIGGTAKTEYVDVSLKPWANVCAFSMVGEPAEQTFKVERCYMETETKVRMHCNYPIVSFDSDYPNLTLTDDYNYSKLVEYYIQNGDLVCTLDKPKYSSYNTIRIVIPEINHILYEITPQFKKTIPGGQYAVENKPIVEYIDVQLTAAVGEFKTVQKQNYRISYNTEHIDVNLSAQAGVFSSMPLARKTYTYNTETISVSLSSAVGVFTTTQQGDLPI